MEMKIDIENELNVQEYNELRQDVGWEVKNDSSAEKAIKGSTIIKKAIYDNKTVGMARAIGNGTSYLLVDVVVGLKYQKKGIGKQLVNSIIEEVENSTLDGQSSTINLISAGNAEKFYESCGFKNDPANYNGYGMKLKINK